MNKTKIEWCDYTWNPLTGCYGPDGTKEHPKHCAYCYAKRIAERFRGGKAFPYGFEPTFHWERLSEPGIVRKPSRIFVCSMADPFGYWVPIDWIVKTKAAVETFNWHTFIFLTKNPNRLAELNPWPKNAYIGISVTSQHQYDAVISYLKILDAKVKFVSIEPLLDYSPMDFRWVNWIIIGQQTPIRAATTPQRSWIEDIEKAADAAGIPVFEKDSLKSLFPDRPLRREMP